MRKKYSLSALLAALILLGSGVDAGTLQLSTPEEVLRLDSLSGTRGGNLITTVPADPSTFNRMLTAGLPHVTVLERLMADLVHINRSTFELEPSLAKRWEVDKDGRTYTVYLRKGVRFSDGSPFTADDVLFTFEALQHPKSGALQAGQLQVDGEFPVLTKLDDHTLRIVFKRPVGMGLRAFDSIPILPRKYLLKAFQEGSFSSAWGPTANPSEIVGLGPFRLKEYQRGVRIVLERNPYYWKRDKSGQALPYLDTITFLIIPDLNAGALRFQSGEIDVTYQVNAENYASLRRAQKEGKYHLQDLGAGLAIDFLWFNLNPGKNSAGKHYVDPEKLAIFDRSEFRRAFSHAINRDGITKSIYLGLGTPQYGPISSGNKVWYNPGIPRTEYNPERAKELLTKAGLKDTNGDGILEFGANRRPLEITMLIARGNAARELMAQVIQQDLGKVGIRVSIQALLQNEVAARWLNSFEYEAVLFRIGVTDVVPDLQTDFWQSRGETHLWHPKQAKPQHAWESETDSLIARLVSDINPASRKRTFNQVQEIWAREMPVIATIAPNVLVGWKSTVGNIRPSVLAPHLLWNAEELTIRSR